MFFNVKVLNLSKKNKIILMYSIIPYISIKQLQVFSPWIERTLNYFDKYRNFLHFVLLYYILKERTGSLFFKL